VAVPTIRRSGSDDPAERVALFRFRVIAEPANPRLTAAERGRLVRALAAQTHAHPDGTMRAYRRPRPMLDDPRGQPLGDQPQDPLVRDPVLKEPPQPGVIKAGEEVEDDLGHEAGMPIRSLALLLGDVRAAAAYRYDARDSLGSRMDTAKVIESPVGGYLAVYHSGRVCHLAVSSDLMTWTHRAVIDEPATQPTIALAPDGGLVTAAEFNDGHGGQLRMRYWPTLDALLQGHPAREFLAPRTLSACNEGTPSIRQVVFDPDVESSRIEVGLHYHRRCRVDRQAHGTLISFESWTAAADHALDAAVVRAAAAAGERIGGNIGDRDHVDYLDRAYDLVEAQGREGDFASWRVYLVERPAMVAQRLEVVTHGGSAAFANPTATWLRDPSGRKAVMVSLFLPVEGAAAGEAGSLLYYVPVDPPASPS
jgi:hypothetical protein